MRPQIYGIGELARETGISVFTLARYRRLKLITSAYVLGKRHIYDENTLKEATKIYKDNAAKIGRLLEE